MRHLVLHAHAAIETKICKAGHIFSEPTARLLPPTLFEGPRRYRSLRASVGLLLSLAHDTCGRLDAFDRLQRTRGRTESAHI